MFDKIIFDAVRLNQTDEEKMLYLAQNMIFAQRLNEDAPFYLADPWLNIWGETYFDIIPYYSFILVRGYDNKFLRCPLPVFEAMGDLNFRNFYKEDMFPAIHIHNTLTKLDNYVGPIDLADASDWAHSKCTAVEIPTTLKRDGLDGYVFYSYKTAMCFQMSHEGEGTMEQTVRQELFPYGDVQHHGEDAWVVWVKHDNRYIEFGNSDSAEKIMGKLRNTRLHLDDE